MAESVKVVVRKKVDKVLISFKGETVELPAETAMTMAVVMQRQAEAIMRSDPGPDTSDTFDV